MAERVAAGRTNAVPDRTSRRVRDILRANVFTFFNGLLAALFVLVLMTGRWQNALFGAVIVVNAGIGVVQELRAKRTLDRLALLTAPRARVIRDGVPQELAVADVVLDDLLELRAGDQVPADARVVESVGLELDESMLTGEVDPVGKRVGDAAHSGAIVVAGRGRAVTTAVGADAYANRLVAAARRFAVTRSELVAGTNTLLRWIAALMLVVGPLVLWSQLTSADNAGWPDALTGTAAALVGMVPEGLVLLTSLAFLLAAVSLARRGTLAQELPAVEGLARVDVVCFDKTGTLTSGEVAFDRFESLAEAAGAADALALLAAVPPANRTAAAIAAAYPATSWRADTVVPFSSARKWTAATVGGHGTWVLGAPEMVLPDSAGPPDQPARARADSLAAAGYRVLLLAHSPAAVEPSGPEPSLPAALAPVGLVVLAEQLRADAAGTLGFFAAQGVAVKVISGDNPRTVGSVATRAGVPGVSGAEDVVDARTLPEAPAALAEVLERRAAFGRVTPHQKRQFVAALQSRGHVVAMTGDGVNDALALKDADIGVAMGNAAPATRAVAQLILLDGRFAHLPEAVAEGRRVLANIERAAKLFLVKNVYSVVLAVVAAVAGAAYPLAPIQLTLISTFTIGVPGFLLALAPSSHRYRPGFVRRVLSFAVPVGVLTGTAAYAAYRIARSLGTGRVDEGRTAATAAAVTVGLVVLLTVSRPIARWHVALLGALALLAATAVSVPAVARSVLLLDVTPVAVGTGLLLGAAGAASVVLFDHVGWSPGRHGPFVTGRSRAGGGA
ncbi:MAG TPA: HAD-IC family P-type ATPase [Jatrophihabitans sp.]|nr:HAD-IC family P-type ATPase [Jatrophihabitans sp.]